MYNQRKLFINKLFRRLQDSNYLLLKYIRNEISQIEESSDLDILIRQEDCSKIEELIKWDQTVEKVLCHQESNMKQYFLFFSDGRFLQIDCLFRLIRKQLIYLPTDYLFANQVQKNGIKTYSDFCLFEHLVLFNQLNYSGLPSKYCRYFQEFPEERLHMIFKRFAKKYSFKVNGISQLAAFQSDLRKNIIAYINRYTQNKFLPKQINNFKYLIDSISKLKRQRGFLITFSGVDGAGKSTVLEATRLLLSEKFRRKTVVIRHRPSIFPILSSFIYGKSKAEKRAATRLPRQGTNKSKVKSLIRFTYYYLDYLLGRSYIFLKYQLRNYIVLYDRYYFDFIVDSERSNLKLDARLTKWLYRFVQKPRLNFFLYAPPEVILKRKQELSKDAIQSLTSGYKEVFEEFDEKYAQNYYAIKNVKIQETLSFINQEIAKAL